MTKISVLMPAYNAEPYIEAAIDSMLNQSHQDFEFIIGDNRSTDRTWEIIQKYASQDSRIIAMRHETNLGIAGNRNRLVERAQSEYVAWQEADDISLPLRLEHQLAFMETHPQVGICGGYLECFDENGIVGIRKYPSGDKELRKLVFRYAPVPQPAAIIRRHCFENVGLYDSVFTPADDLEMTLRLGTRFELANLPEVVMRFRLHNNASSTTFSKLKTLERHTIAVRKKYARAYNMNLFDRLYNIAQELSIYLIPPRFKIWLFNFFRNSRA